MIKTKQGNSDQRLNYAQRDSLHNAVRFLHLKWEEKKNQGFWAECNWGVQTACYFAVHRRKSDGYFCSYGGRSSEESSSECSTFYLD